MRLEHVDRFFTHVAGKHVEGGLPSSPSSRT
jgi:hypothetical protein